MTTVADRVAGVASRGKILHVVEPLFRTAEAPVSEKQRWLLSVGRRAGRRRQCCQQLKWTRWSVDEGACDAIGEWRWCWRVW